MWAWDSEKEELLFTGVVPDIPVADTLLTDETPEKEEKEKKDPKTTNDEELVITLEDVKNVALQMVKREHVCPKDFSHFLSLPVVDSLIHWTLRYFFYYFRELEYEQPFITDVTGESEAAYTLPELQKCLAFCNQKLGEQYCSLLLGVGSSDFHHMRGGRGFMSHNLKDRSLYECLYTLLIEAVYITFGKKDRDVICEEIGRLVRSDAYNPSKNDDDESFGFEEDERDLQPKHTKHFQQSPLLQCALFPVDKRPAHSSSGYEMHLDSSKKAKEEKSEILEMNDDKMVEFIFKETENVGILGMKRADFDDDLELKYQG